MQLFSLPAEASKAPEAVAPPVRPEPEPEDPEEARKKELASALFATSGTTSSARTRVSRAKKGGTGARHRSGSSTKETGDLLGGDLLGVTGPTAGAAPASAVGDLDFFGLEGGLPSGGEMAVSTPAAAPLPMPTGDLHAEPYISYKEIDPINSVWHDSEGKKEVGGNQAAPRPMRG